MPACSRLLTTRGPQVLILALVAVALVKLLLGSASSLGLHHRRRPRREGTGSRDLVEDTVDTVKDEGVCRHTVPNREGVTTDDHGRMCRAAALLHSSEGCCPVHSPATSASTAVCSTHCTGASCSTLPACVACCMDASHASLRASLLEALGPHHPTWHTGEVAAALAAANRAKLEP